MNFLSKKIMPRYFLVTLMLALLALSVVGKALYTMTADREYWLEMSKLQVKEGRPLPAKRGNILAADGQVLAASLPEYEINLDFMSTENDTAWSKDNRYLKDTTVYRSLAAACRLVQSVYPDENLTALRARLLEDWREKDQYRRDTVLMLHMNEICAGFHRIFPDVEPGKLRAHLLAGRRARSRYWPVYTRAVTSLPLRKRENRRISYVEYSEVSKLPLFRLRSSANFRKIEMRRRPFGELAVRTIGDFKDTARYGLELTFDSALAGRPGSFHFEKVMNRRVVQIDSPAVDGCDVMTTLDVTIQEICEKALSDKLKELEAKSGVCIVMEVATGDIKGMTGLTRHEDGSYHEDTALPVTDIYEPGSVFKPMSFLVAFDDGKIKMDDQVDVGGGVYNFGNRKMRDHNWRSGGYGVLTVPQIIQRSSNVGVSYLINKYYHDDPAAFVKGLERIGVKEDLKIPLPGYQKPRIRRPGEGAYWSSTTLPWMSIGYETQLAPINTLNFYNGIANNGCLLRPRLVKAILRDGKVVKEFPVTVLRKQMARPEAVRNIRTCLEEVVSIGLGKAGGSRYFPVAAKTGTAQIWTGRGRTSEYFISYAGYFPADKPLYSCIVCIRKTAPASGGGMCGPVFKRVAESIMARNHVADYSKARDTVRCKQPVRMAGDMAAAARLFREIGVGCRAGMPVDGREAVWGKSGGSGNDIVLLPAEDADGRMPDVEGYGLRDALYRLERMGLRVKAEGVGLVREQSIRPGHAVKRGQTVRLTLGEKPRKPRAVAQPAAQGAAQPVENRKKRSN